MAEVLIKTIHNCETGETTEVPLTAEEIAQYEADLLEAQALEAERLAAEQAIAALKASAKAKLIAGEPLTADEADTLVI